MLTLLGDWTRRLEPPPSKWPHLDRMTPLFRVWNLTSVARVPHGRQILLAESSSRDAHERIVFMVQVNPADHGNEKPVPQNEGPGPEEGLYWARFASSVTVQLRVLGMDAERAAQFEREKGGRIGTKDVLNLWGEGKMDTKWVQRLKTMNGVNAILETGEEHLFPTRMEARGEDTPPLFYDFDTRTAGWSLNVTPVYQNDLLSLALTGKWTERMPDRNGDPIRASFSQREISSHLVLPPGRPHLIGHSTSPDRKERWYWLLHTEVRLQALQR